MGEVVDFQKAIDTYIHMHRKPQEYAKNVFRASELSGCVRQCVKRRIGLSEIPSDGLRRMEIGTVIHHFMQQNVGLGGIGRPVEFEKEVFLQIEELCITGHIDCWDGETIYDFKTTADLESTMLYDTNEAYIYQLSVYLHAIKAFRAVLVYIDKRNLCVQQREIAPLSEKRIAEFCRAVTKAEEIYISTNELPAKDDCYACRTEAFP